MFRFRTLTVATLALAGGVALATLPTITAEAGARQSPTPPHIVVRPSSVMVRQPMRLVGTGFNPDSTLTIKECSQTRWVVNQNPCAGNAIQVTTNANGSFRGTMTAELCPRAAIMAVPLPAETCYVGNPKPSGLDEITLVGAARITVTYP